jgi:hypothetical protein
VRTITPTTKTEQGTALAETTTHRPLVRAEVIAKHFDVHVRTALLWAERGIVPAVKVGSSVRFDFDAVLAAVKGGRK